MVRPPHPLALIQLSKYLEGPEEFKFGREELDRVFGNEQYPTEANEMCGAPRGANLAVVLLDAPRAFKIRRLRDALQAASLKADAEIKAFEPLASLPFARKPWAIHHQRLFSAVCYAVKHNLPDRGRYSPAVVRAAMMWSLSFARPGELDPIHLENVGRAKACMREAGYGRRASASEEVTYGEENLPAVNQPPASLSGESNDGKGTETGGWPTTICEPQTSADGW
ncbi:hypothetical protein LTR36_003898 [Oleoguttula mirabilis]|uniref:Uncharacterized protein n=1 Tax=Oleoguttula mirabilis TaxID=1507867 RepID=A0AAV9JJC5_9PEZI|nr:hypothetical protein LTR36_003898 [Oleoguttula mirabilis]